MKRIFNCIILILITFTVQAQNSDNKPDTWYEVEIILFENLDPASIESEQWPLNVAQPNLTDSIELLEYPSEMTDSVITQSVAEPSETSHPYLDTPYLILPANQYQLTNAYQKLVDSDNYLPRVHLAWRQIVPPRDQPDRIHIHDDGDSTVIEVTDQLDIPPVINLNMEESVINTAAPDYIVNGIISLGLGRYLHVDVDLLLHKPLSDENMEIFKDTSSTLLSSLKAAPFSFHAELEPEIKETPQLFSIQGNLRMRSKEVHYMDHPLMGMLILFTPYTPPEPEIIVEEIAPEQSSNKAASGNITVVKPGREKEDRSF